MRLLIAEDEVDLAEALTVFFEKNHFSVDAVHNGFDAYEYASSGAYDAVILDVMMPKMDGIQVLKKLRQEGVKTPIMMLTAKGQKSDRITGFNAGADDYLPKPFDPDELLSRVRAILRRSEAYQPTVLAYGDLTLDPGSGNLSCGKDPIRLSGREFQIMELFMRSPRQVFSAERIMEPQNEDDEKVPAPQWRFPAIERCLACRQYLCVVYGQCNKYRKPDYLRGV